MIRNSRMIFVSDHPSISTWWWIGLVRSTRRRKVRKAKPWIIT
jgi:hypothetical protein